MMGKGLDAGTELKKKITSFKDLEIYQKSYKLAITVIKKIIPRLPKEEKFDLADQIRRSVKAIPRLIAKGYTKRHQRKGFQKYLDDALAESNETIVSLSQARDIYLEIFTTWLLIYVPELSMNMKSFLNKSANFQQYGFHLTTGNAVLIRIPASKPKPIN